MSLSGIALVTGGAGFIGSHIAESLAQSGARVRIIDDLSTGHIENVEGLCGRVDFIRGSLNDRPALERALEDVELVFHEAAIPSVPRSIFNPRATHEACVDATFNLLEAARSKGVRRLVYAASSSAYGDQPTLPKTEAMKPAPLSPYAVAKLVGEYYCHVWARAYGLETVCLRYFNVFGPRQDPSSPYSGVISKFIDCLMSNQSPVIFGDGEQSRDFTYVANAVDANLRAAQTARGIGETINIATGERTTLNQLLQILKSLTLKENVTAEYKENRPGDVRHSLADVSRARELLGYQPRVGVIEGLRLTIDWWISSRYARSANVPGGAALEVGT
jgi:nucleoside-diphosphate-sugar epimerase